MARNSRGDERLRDFYGTLLRAVAGSGLRDGEWQLCECAGWPDNHSAEQLLAWCWRANGQRHLVVVNLAPEAAQGQVRLPWDDLAGREWQLHDALAGEAFARDGNSLQREGLYVGMAAVGELLPRPRGLTPSGPGRPRDLERRPVTRERWMALLLRRRLGRASWSDRSRATPTSSATEPTRSRSSSARCCSPPVARCKSATAFAQRHSPRAGRASWWAAAIQSAGTVCFNVTTYRALHTALSSPEYNKLVWRPDALGSICFLGSGAIAYRASARNGWLPARRGRGWWEASVNLIGCILFGISAVAGHLVPSTGSVIDQAAANWTTSLGAVCFFACALFTLVTGRTSKSPRRRLRRLARAVQHDADRLLGGDITSSE